MKALILRRKGVLDLVSRAKPRIKPGEVLLRVACCGICKTDAKMWQQGHRDLTMPRIPGHEITGTLEGSTDAFAVWPGKSCSRCSLCRQGSENLCARMQVIGFHRDGGFAQAVSVPRSALIPLPAGLSLTTACFAEPLACGLNAVEHAAISRGGKGIIYGGGTAGLLTALAARDSGGRPFVVETKPQKLAKSSRFRRRAGIAAGSTPPKGPVDWVINATPSPQTFIDGLSRLKAGGCFCIFSGFTGRNTIPADVVNEVHYRQLNVSGAYGCTRRQMHRALELLAISRDAVTGLIESEIGLDEVRSVLPSVQSGTTLKYIVTLKTPGRNVGDP